jgi:uncharacterized protein YlaI
MTNLETGEVTEYIDQEDVFDRDSLDNYEIRTMDCMDCHNRPSHDYKSPSNYVDHLLGSGEVPKELPEIKRLAMEILYQDYGTRDTAFMVIEEQIKAFYADTYPEIAAAGATLIEQAIAGIKKGFSQNQFPYMKVRSSVYPNHLGHLESPGCARCHDDMHLSDNGANISRDCNLCHNITAQGTPGNMQVGTIYDSLEFKHPVDIDQMWKEFLCDDCHAAMY